MSLRALAAILFLLSCLVPAAPIRAQQGPASQNPRPDLAPPAGPAAGPPASAAPPGGMRSMPIQQPSWIPLPSDHQKYLDTVLEYWEFRSSKIERFRCQFTLFEYDAAFGPYNPVTRKLDYRSVSSGQIVYAAPDKGLYRIDTIKDFRSAPRNPDGSPPASQGSYVLRANDKGQPIAGEYWTCNGKSIFKMEHEKKELQRLDLPPELQGQAIVDGPMPFMFGAKASMLKQRFWFRVVTPADRKDEYWLEAWPKSQQDAANYQYAVIILDQKEYLPKAVEQNLNFAGAPGQQGNRRAFVFDNREANWNEGVSGLLKADIFSPSAPWGYKLVVEKPPVSGPPSGGAPAAQDRPFGPAATRPQSDGRALR